MNKVYWPQTLLPRQAVLVVRHVSLGSEGCDFALTADFGVDNARGGVCPIRHLLSIPKICQFFGHLKPFEAISAATTTQNKTQNLLLVRCWKWGSHFGGDYILYFFLKGPKNGRHFRRLSYCANKYRPWATDMVTSNEGFLQKCKSSATLAGDPEPEGPTFRTKLHAPAPVDIHTAGTFVHNC